MGSTQEKIDTIVAAGSPRAQLTWLACRIERYLQGDACETYWDNERHLKMYRGVDSAHCAPQSYRTRVVLEQARRLRLLVKQFDKLHAEHPEAEVDEGIIRHNQKVIDGSRQMLEHARLRGTMNEDHFMQILRDNLYMHSRDNETLTNLFRTFDQPE